jgi:hypothetical protein
MNSFEIYVDYLALKQHFNHPTYDYFKYHGKLKNASPASFERRNDKYAFQKLTKHKSPHNLFLANLIDKDRWIKDMTQDRYLEWERRQQSLAYLFKTDLGKLQDDFDSNFQPKVGKLPYIQELYTRNEISAETITILIDKLQLWEYYTGNLSNPVYMTRLQKYAPFLKYDWQKLRGMIITRWQKESRTS